MVAIGVDGGITGWGGDLVIVDDPFKSRADADSLLVRNKVWVWWTDTLSSRLEKDASVVIIMQRWHMDDLAGRLLAETERKKDEEDYIPWVEIKMPALIETPEQAENCPLGRKIGDALWPELHPPGEMRRKKVERDIMSWSSQYQQEPTPESGMVFRRSNFCYYDVGTTLVDAVEETYYELLLPEGKTKRVFKKDMTFYQAVDTAMKAKTIHDYTVVSTVGKTPDGEYLVVDVARVRLEVPDQMDFVLQQKKKWDPVWVGIEDKQSGTGLIQQGQRLGLPIKSLKAVTDKVDRAATASIQYQAKAIFHPVEETWLSDLETELLTFPNGVHDDIVDTISYLLRECGQGPGIFLG